MRFVNLVYWVGELTSAPVFQSVNLATAIGHQLGIALDHPWDLFGLVGMHQEYDFIVSHRDSFWVNAFQRSLMCVVRQGVM